MNANATAPHQKASPLYSRRRNMVAVRRRVLNSVCVRDHPCRSHTRSAGMTSLPDLGSLSVTGSSPPRLPVAPPEVRSLNSISQPQEHEIDIETFLGKWPSLNGTPLRFIRDTLSNSKGNQMLHSVRNTRILEYFNKEEPRECKVLFDGPPYDGDVIPTHILAVHQGDEVRLFPVHQIVFAANCATLPDFPNSSSESSDILSIQFTLPVVKLEVPSLKSFHILYDYLYTKDMDLLRQTFQSLRVDAGCISNLYRQIEFIRDLWKNACALSVVDMGIYILMRELYVEAQMSIRDIEMEPF